MNLEDFKNKKGKWVQRSWVGAKYTWTTSGVLWNNIKERCTVNGATQQRESTYIGCTNDFTDFQSFTDWHVKQKGYGCGYQLDADILIQGIKKYSENNCVLIPPSLNKFLQSYKGKRGPWPQGMYLREDRLIVEIEHRGICKYLGSFPLCDIDKAVATYSDAKTSAGLDWYNRLLTDEFSVDCRVVEYMKNWRYICDWEPNGQI